jgi:hypothetical protein
LQHHRPNLASGVANGIIADEHGVEVFTDQFTGAEQCDNS